MLPVVMIAVPVVLCVVGLVIEVGRDGYGRTQPPRSHPADEFDPRTQHAMGATVSATARAAVPLRSSKPRLAWASVVERVVPARAR